MYRGLYGGPTDGSSWGFKLFFGIHGRLFQRAQRKSFRPLLQNREAQGVVSEEAVQGMLQGLFRLTEADYGIAVSGIAGPGGGTEKKPVGTICYALGPKKGAPQVGTLHLQGNRETIILLTSKKLLDLLWQLINNK